MTNTYMNWTVNASKKLTLNNDFSIAASRTFTVNGTLDCNTRLVTGAGAFSLASTGTISTANTSGVDGSIQVTGTKTYTSGGSYEFHAATTTPFPASLGTVTAAGVVVDANVTLNKNVSVTNTLNLTTGKLTIPAGSSINSGIRKHHYRLRVWCFQAYRNTGKHKHWFNKYFACKQSYRYGHISYWKWNLLYAGYTDHSISI